MRRVGSFENYLLFLLQKGGIVVEGNALGHVGIDNCIVISFYLPITFCSYDATDGRTNDRTR